MATILLADDERIFKVVQGTLLRREACRLLKAPFDSLPSLAVEHHPDLVIVPASAGDEAVDRVVRELRASADAETIPIIILDIDGSEVEHRSLEPDRGAPIEIVRSGATLDPDLLESKLADMLEKHLELKGRRTERIATDLPVRCTSGTTRFTARTKDISMSGLFLKTEHGVHPGDRIAVSVRLPAEGRRLRSGADIAGECEVVRLITKNRDDPDLIPGAGLRFVRLSKEGRAELERLAAPGAGSAREVTI